MKLNFKKFGSGSPLVILHGLFGTLDNWQTIAKQLSTDFLVYILDLRNHGRSPHNNVMNYEIMAADLYNFMQEEGILKAHLMGHSMGGKVAMQFANNFRSNLDKLIVVDMAPKKYFGGHVHILESLESLPIQKISSRKEATFILEEKLKDTAVVLFLLKNLSRRQEGGFKWKMNLKILIEQYPQLMENILIESPVKNETLFLRGGLSRYIKEEDFLLIKKVFHNAQFLTVENSGHWIHAEQPAVFLEKVKSFLN